MYIMGMTKGGKIIKLRARDGFLSQRQLKQANRIAKYYCSRSII